MTKKELLARIEVLEARIAVLEAERVVRVPWYPREPFYPQWPGQQIVWCGGTVYP